MNEYVLVDSLHAGGTLRQTIVVQLDSVAHRTVRSVADEGKTGLAWNNWLTSNKSADSTEQGEGEGGSLPHVSWKSST